MYTEKVDVSHTTISKALFICKRQVTNIKPTVPLLCTIVKVPDEDDWDKLLRMMHYPQETRDYKLTLSINNMNMTDWYAHADFALHADMKNHTVGVLKMFKGSTQTISMKQKINIKFSM